MMNSEQPCPACNADAVKYREQQEFLHGSGADAVMLTLDLPAFVSHCSACGFVFTEPRFEAVRDRAVRRYLSDRYDDETQKELDDLQRTFDLMWAADQRAIKLWQANHPGQETIWPDRTQMVTWLLERLEAVERDRDHWREARRSAMEAGEELAKQRNDLQNKSDSLRLLASFYRSAALCGERLERSDAEYLEEMRVRLAKGTP